MYPTCLPYTHKKVLASIVFFPVLLDSLTSSQLLNIECNIMVVYIDGFDGKPCKMIQTLLYEKGVVSRELSTIIIYTMHGYSIKYRHACLGLLPLDSPFTIVCGVLATFHL